MLLLLVWLVVVISGLYYAAKVHQKKGSTPPPKPPVRKPPVPTKMPGLPKDNSIIGKATNIAKHIGKFAKDATKKVKDEFDIGAKYRVSPNGPKDALCGGSKQGGDKEKQLCCAVQGYGDGKSLFKGCIFDNDPKGCMKARGCSIAKPNNTQLAIVKSYCKDNGGASNEKCYTDRGVCKGDKSTCYPGLLPCNAFNFNSDVGHCGTSVQGLSRCKNACCDVQMFGKGAWAGCLKTPNPAQCMKDRGCALGDVSTAAQSKLLAETNKQCKGLNGGGQNEKCYTDRGVCTTKGNKLCWPDGVPCANFGTFDSKFGKCGTARQGAKSCQSACCLAQHKFCKAKPTVDEYVTCMDDRGCKSYAESTLSKGGTCNSMGKNFRVLATWKDPNFKCGGSNQGGFGPCKKACCDKQWTFCGKKDVKCMKQRGCDPVKLGYLKLIDNGKPHYQFEIGPHRSKDSFPANLCKSSISSGGYCRECLNNGDCSGSKVCDKFECKSKLANNKLTGMPLVGCSTNGPGRQCASGCACGVGIGLDSECTPTRRDRYTKCRKPFQANPFASNYCLAPAGCDCYTAYGAEKCQR